MTDALKPTEMEALEITPCTSYEVKHGTRTYLRISHPDGIIWYRFTVDGWELLMGEEVRKMAELFAGRVTL